MPNLVTDKSLCKCSFGLAPAAVTAGPQSVGSSMNMKVLTEFMIVPNTNIPPFGMCNSMANPAVASATAAAMGVLTPQPCTPVIVGPWSPCASAASVLGQKAVTTASKCNCAYGGVITIVQTPNTLATSV